MWSSTLARKSHVPNATSPPQQHQQQQKELGKNEIHLKRVAQILRYISTMQLNGNSIAGQQISFVRNTAEFATDKGTIRPFFQDSTFEVGSNANEWNNASEQDEEYSSTAGGVLFTIFDFQRLAAILNQITVALPSDTNTHNHHTFLPFHFYTTKSTSTTSGGGRSIATTNRLRSLSETSTSSSSTCWLRLTRLVGGAGGDGDSALSHYPKGYTSSSSLPSTLASPPPIDATIREYLQAWKDTVVRDPQYHHHQQQQQQQQASLTSWLSLEQLNRAPSTDSPKIQRWIRRQRRYLQSEQLKRLLEPMYNHLFEWYHQKDLEADLDLIWGLGQAKLHRQEADGTITIVDGPLLEVRVEVELARDGALLVRPKEHTGVSLNQSVISALGSNANAARQLRQTVEGLEAASLAPGEPTTYTQLLKRIAVELSPGGTFQSSKTASNKLKEYLNRGQLVVTDAWCLYSSPRPRAVWARDALTLAENLSTNKSTAGLLGSASTNLDTQTLHLPKALWALTHGPGALDDDHPNSKEGNLADTQSIGSSFSSALSIFTAAFQTKRTIPEPPIEIPSRPQFPLPTSDAQNRIADLLLTKNYPAVVCEGPPGTGKTHTIANIVCAYLCQGKRVLVTSKGAPALSVLRERLPECVQELCVDVSMSESTGMRQLQQTVERLANKVAWVNTEREIRRSEALEQNIEELETELKQIDTRLGANAEARRTLVQTKNGQELFELSLELIETAPWLMKTIAKWDTEKIKSFHTQLETLVIPPGDPIDMVTGYPSPPSDALISLAASKAGLPLSYLKNATKQAFASVPMLGSRMADHCSSVKEALQLIRINGAPPKRREDWYLVFQALERKKAIHSFCNSTLEPLFMRENWPEESFIQKDADEKRIQSDAVKLFETAVKARTLAEDLDVTSTLDEAIEMELLDKRRFAIANRIQTIAEDLVAARVVAELSKNFSAEAQSALVTFAQVSGKAKFGKSSQPSKMTQRQRRKRQEYLTAFEKCVRYIPCWILTTSQISDYLPSECLFDLVVIDEASQSDVTVLPGMMRGKQWLIVGDGKQVSPTESFVAEEQIEMLKAALPDSPFEASMLPGHSFFDLCAQAFPRGRVILREHFRCAPEIIAYSNAEFYNGNLVPLRLPTSTERLKPSLLDVRLTAGRKTGKVNEQECDEIVRRIKNYVESCTLLRKRSIGVISLIGEEQSRLIRGRLLDQIGPHKFKLHNILVGEPPSFQGAERDIVYLSMVCSPKSVVTQSQLMHAQRMNVALSRARDRMVLVRSIDTNHLPNEQDIKFSVLDFFERANHITEQASDEMDMDDRNIQKLRMIKGLSPFRARAELLLIKLLEEQGYTTQSMGVVWDNAICVEDASSSYRAGICVEATGETQEEWKSMLEQQKSIERVGWNCLRVDAVSLLTNYAEVLASVGKFLASVNVHPAERPKVVEEVKDTKQPVDDEVIEVELDVQRAAAVEPQAIAGGEEGSNSVDDADVGARNEQAAEQENDDLAVVISSDDDNDSDRKPAAVPIKVEKKEPESIGLGSGETAADYGNVAELDFLQGASIPMEDDDESFEVKILQPPPARRRPFGGNREESIEHDEEGVKDVKKRGRMPAPQPAVASRPRKKRRAPVRDAKRKVEMLSSEEENEDSDLLEKQRAVAESTTRTFSNDELSNGSSDEELDGYTGDAVSIAPSTVSKSSKRRRGLDSYSRDPRYYMKRSDEQDDISHAEYIGEVHPEPKWTSPRKKNEKNNDDDKDDGYDQEEHSDDDSYREEEE